MELKKSNEVTESVITAENQYVDTLSSVAKTAGTTNFGLLAEDSKVAINAKEAEINEYIKNNVVNDENRDTIIDGAIELWNQYKDLVKNGSCFFTLNNLEIRTVDKKLHSSVEYDTETLFYGLHLKKFFVDALPNPKGDDFLTNDILISFSNAIALYHVLSTLKVKGLNKENYAFAHILYKLSEISKVYQHYDGVSSRLNQSIGQWTMGLNPAQAEELIATVNDAVTAEAQA
jgi:hypothetical protein